MTQESLRKKMTNRTLARTIGLPPRPHLHQRHHGTTDNKSTNTNRVPLKNKMPEMVDSNLRFTERHSFVTREIRRNRDSNELFDKDTHMKKQPCSTTTTLIQMTRKPVAIMTYRKYDVLGFPSTSWHLGDVHNHQTIKPQHNAVFSELHNFLHL